MPESESRSYQLGFKWGAHIAKRMLDSDCRTTLNEVFEYEERMRNTPLFGRYKDILDRLNEDDGQDDFDSAVGDAIRITKTKYVKFGCV